MNILFTHNIGELTEIQRSSFYSFLVAGIYKELSLFPNPFVTQINQYQKEKLFCLVFFYLNKIKLEGPFSDQITCIENNRTYGINVYVLANYTYLNPENLNTKYINKTNILLGQIPLMTEDGTFIINGCEKIVVSQIIKSPGLYFKKEIGLLRKTLYTATLIADNGLFTKFILDQNSNIYIGINSFKKEKNFKNQTVLPIIDVLRYFGLSLFEIMDQLKMDFKLSNLINLNLKNKFENFDKIKLFKKLYLKQIFGCFYLNEIGRYKLNKKLNLNISKSNDFLTVQDILEIIKKLNTFKNQNFVPFDPDNLKEKRIRSIGDLLQLQLKVGLSLIKKNLNKNKQYLKYILLGLKNTNNFSISTIPEKFIFNNTLLTKIIRDFFNTNELIQYMDQNNPLAEATHKRRISLFGLNGFNRNNLNVFIRDLHPSHYSRLCLIDTPEGQNAGLISSLALFGRVNSLGLLEAPYFIIKDKKMLVKTKAIYLDNDQEIDSTIATSNSFLNKKKEFNTSFLFIKNSTEFLIKKVDKIAFMTPSSAQIFSLGSAIIPFFEHNDANRTLMGSNMQRQSISLLYSQKPLVISGFESNSLLTSSLVIKSYCEGIVIYASSLYIKIKDNNDQIITYYLRKYFKSNQKILINQVPLV
jgi:DNA-directed RNA polymerase subunit beta